MLCKVNQNRQSRAELCNSPVCPYETLNQSAQNLSVADPSPPEDLDLRLAAFQSFALRIARE